MHGSQRAAWLHGIAVGVAMGTSVCVVGWVTLHGISRVKSAFRVAVTSKPDDETVQDGTNLEPRTVDENASKPPRHASSFQPDLSHAARDMDDTYAGTGREEEPMTAVTAHAPPSNAQGSDILKSEEFTSAHFSQVQVSPAETLAAPLAYPVKSLSSQDFAWTVLWDFENVTPPLNVSGNHIINRLRTLLGSYRQTSAPHPIVRIMILCDVHRMQVCLQNELQANGVNICHVPRRGRKEASDKALLVELGLVMRNHQPPFGICLISGDSDFAYGLAVARNLGYLTAVFAPAARQCSPFLTNVAHKVWSFPKDVLASEHISSTPQHLIRTGMVSEQVSETQQLISTNNLESRNLNCQMHGIVANSSASLPKHDPYPRALTSGRARKPIAAASAVANGSRESEPRQNLGSVTDIATCRMSNDALTGKSLLSKDDAKHYRDRPKSGARTLAQTEALRANSFHPQSIPDTGGGGHIGMVSNEKLNSEPTYSDANFSSGRALEDENSHLTMQRQRKVSGAEEVHAKKSEVRKAGWTQRRELRHQVRNDSDDDVVRSSHGPLTIQSCRSGADGDFEVSENVLMTQSCQPKSSIPGCFCSNALVTWIGAMGFGIALFHISCPATASSLWNVMILNCSRISRELGVRFRYVGLFAVVRIILVIGTCFWLLRMRRQKMLENGFVITARRAARSVMQNEESEVSRTRSSQERRDDSHLRTSSRQGPTSILSRRRKRPAISTLRNPSHL